MISPVLPTYARINLEFERGEGCWLVTTDGRRYLDFTAGIAVNVLGHANPYLAQALTEQAGKLWHTSNLFRIAGGERLAERLTQATFADTVFFTNSGAEALECAIKMARKYQYVSGHPERNRLIAFEGAFHGRTLATIAAGGNAKYLEGFGPELPGFDHVPFGDLEAVKAAIGPATAGILLEPIQGEGGVRVPPSGFLAALRALCDEHGLLLVLDEVQSGVGRTGKLFAHEWAGVTPDIMSVAKGIGGGFPMGACLATEEAAKGMTLGTHGSTYGGNPLAMAVGNAVLDKVLEPSFLEHVNQISLRFTQLLAGVKDRHPGVIAEVRGQGLLLGLRANVPAGDLVVALREEGLLAPGAGDNVVRLLPPLVVSEEEVKLAAEKIEAACRRIEDGLAAAPVKGAAE
ncbi:acetylornithine and succinylornithine aminotransferase [Azorhizobium caulinodans ORS 571]|uniref:Acetylornithine aminotransferase n=1 Tax=Azorhizobium caulinodans (strain ATCC 43989 / DSM 5975 / JCM 20966 / LMG 6465 / NBRC 14845 / NCIMB 13405 / ORS 571) TaxID=438753 RepID=A8ILF9_AZOC5|nr:MULTISPECIES: aspartate aminotransferase family protein [Azorhizobium]TDU00678.1 acetylornithine/N-succinyldiaminopimelate aminotransferase [Azorhizobium sp. AG788]BAF90026.1 acetylornithine and succinylornithine aminotransferase [Azorhizobium caulinodans ORS 571]